jgi:integrase
MPHANLSAKFVCAATCPQDKRKIEFIDNSLEGFFIEVLATGIKTYYQRYVDAHKRQRQIRIGRVGIVPHVEARKRALQIKADVSLGKNPRQADDDLKEVTTLKEFALKRYLPFVEQNKRSWTADEVIVRCHLLPALGNLYLDEISPTNIIQMMTNMRAQGYANGTCNRPVIILRYMLNLASDWGIPRLELNPAKKVSLFEETERQRFLSAGETKALIDAARMDENQLAANAIELLLLTGGRRNEITQAAWEHVDLAKGTLLVPLSKSGKPRTIALNVAAIDLISSLPSRGRSKWLFPSGKTNRPCPSICSPWERIRKRAGLYDLRLHDLRHSYASNLVNGGVSLYIVQQLLGHTNPRTTQRYAHLERDTLSQASEIAAQTVLRAVSG